MTAQPTGQTAMTSSRIPSSSMADQITWATDLLRPIYSKTTNYGHFGRTDDLESLTWEKTDKAEILRKEGFGK